MTQKTYFLVKHDKHYDLQDYESNIIASTDPAKSDIHIHLKDVLMKLYGFDVMTVDTTKGIFNIKDILEAIKHGFEYHRDSQNDGIDVPKGNKLQWLQHYIITKSNRYLVSVEITDNQELVKDDNNFINIVRIILT